VPSIRGKVDSITPCMKPDGYEVIIHLHSQGLCYETTLREGAACAFEHLVEPGDIITVIGTVTTVEGTIRDIDAVQLEVKVQGINRLLNVGYRCEFIPSALEVFHLKYDR
jgi:hypothetical protein